MAPEKLKEILEEAGWHRLRQRRSLAQARVSSFGFAQAVWIALAEGLGFSENRDPFAMLARGIPIQKLLEIADPVERAAILYGTAGLLPDPTRSKVSDRALPWLHKLWDRWWGQREDWMPYILVEPGPTTPRIAAWPPYCTSRKALYGRGLWNLFAMVIQPVF
ncbi:MAG: DUF2851 family protein [Verrucomicrobia bacterium]|nr:DUF2851 family protein [Verrucomicrobiota bacterium]